MSNQTFSIKRLDKMPFTGLFIFMLQRKLRQSGEMSEDELEVVEYYYLSRIGEIEKFLWITVIFALLSIAHLPIFLVTSIVVLSIRIPSGGMHSNSTWGCFCLTLLIFLTAIFVLPQIPLNMIGMIVIAIFSIIICYMASPIRGIDREKYIDKSKDKLLKYAATTITSVWFILIFVLNNNHHGFAITMIWAIFLQNLQLMIEYYKRKRLHNL